MIKFIYLCFVSFLVVNGQENAQKSLSPSLRECYNNTYLTQKDNLLPHTMNTLIAIIRKIENSENLNMDLRSLSVALLHRFRQDGIRRNPAVPIQDGVLPYAANGNQYYRHSQILKLIPGNAVLFPNNSISAVERCTLHSMISSSIEIFERGDENTVCRFAQSMYRYKRNTERSKKGIEKDVETLSPEQIEGMTNNKNNVDPNTFYPDLPPNHPDVARLYALPPISKCPAENGVVKTQWGNVAAGGVLAGIASAVEPQEVTLGDLLKEKIEQYGLVQTSNVILSNKWISTLAGDLAEMAVSQGSHNVKFTIGVNGNWNSSVLPRWYFLESNENHAFTMAEIRGDLDGLILAKEVARRYQENRDLRLSEILDMYYSPRGLFDRDIRACNRRVLFTSVSPLETLIAQTYSAGIVLSTDLAKATLEPAVVEKFATQAAKDLSTFIPSSMNSDMNCEVTDRLNDFNSASVDLTIILDTNWPFESMQNIISTLIENLDVNPYNSNYTLVNGVDGSVIINSTDSILDFYKLNSTNIVSKGFNLAKSIESLRKMQSIKMENERRLPGGGNSDVVILLPYTGSFAESEKEYILYQLTKMHESTPDAVLLIMAHNSKDKWAELVVNSSKDLFVISGTDTPEALSPVSNLISRIKQVPKRLINTQCGSDYTSIGNSNSFTDYLEPNSTNFYRLHPNYFYIEGSRSVKIQGSSSNTLTVCASRALLHVNATEEKASAECKTISNNQETFWLSCGGASFIHDCQPFYLSVSSNNTQSSYQCMDQKACRFHNMIKYTISYENLVCVSGSSQITSNVMIFILIAIYYFCK